MLVIPVFDTLILSDVQINVQETVFSELEIANIKKEEQFIILPIKEQKERSELKKEDFYSVGILASASTFLNTEGSEMFLVNTKERVSIKDLWFDEGRVEADCEYALEICDVSKEEEEQFFAEFKTLSQQLIQDLPGSAIMRGHIRRWKSLNEAATNIGAYLDLDEKERAAVLVADSHRERYTLLLEGLRRLVGTKAVQEELKSAMSSREQDAYKAMAIKKQMKLLEEQLAKMDNETVSEEAMFEKRIQEAGMPKEAEKEARRVLKRFAMEGGHGSEYGTLYEYLDFITSLCWKEEEKTEISIQQARKVLDAAHYGLEKPKKRIIEQIAVMSLCKKPTGSILLLVGAPGTGKTSIGQSVADALGRKYVRISLGGVRDEAEIRGHRRTYVGAMPGRIMEGIKRANAKNPVVVLDEIDKLGQDYKGDPASALLEVLDPEQNSTFTDHYMNVPYDLSQVFFLCTANSLEGIPKPLLDRMEVISLTGYTAIEKYHIGKKYLLKKAMEEAGINKGQLSITQGALKSVISNYTMEAGVRGLKKQLDKICRNTAVKILEGTSEKVTVKEADLYEILGKKTVHHEDGKKARPAGVATGLAWTQAGGEILYIEAVAVKGSGKICLTGKLGEVMKESANIAYSLVKAKYGDSFDFEKTDIHIHVPEGAVPKDGPSAGITMVTALISLIKKQSVKKGLAMTGEVSLTGQVHPIGGLPEKLMAAQRAGVKKVLVPKRNEEDLQEVPDEVTQKLEIVLVDTIQEVIKEAGLSD